MPIIIRCQRNDLVASTGVKVKELGKTHQTTNEVKDNMNHMKNEPMRGKDKGISFICE